MEKTMGRVLKADEVKLQGQYHLNITPASQQPAIAGQATSGSPQVRLVESNADYAVMEITCSCGAKTHVRCEYDKK